MKSAIAKERPAGTALTAALDLKKGSVGESVQINDSYADFGLKTVKALFAFTAYFLAGTTDGDFVFWIGS